MKYYYLIATFLLLSVGAVVCSGYSLLLLIGICHNSASWILWQAAAFAFLYGAEGPAKELGSRS